MDKLLRLQFDYHAWANQALFDSLAPLTDPDHSEIGRLVLALIDHAHVTACIFAGHLRGEPHDYQGTSSLSLPSLATLRAAVSATDHWYCDYLAALSPAVLEQEIAFTFTDGDHGRMSRGEMLLHVLSHSSYHRGEAGRLLRQHRLRPLDDGLAAFLHRREPGRRAA